MRKLKTFIKAPKKKALIIKKLGHLGFLKFIPDKIYLRFLYKAEFGRKLNLENPTRFTEKLQYLKIDNKAAINTQLVDKYLVRNYIKNEIDVNILIPLLGAYDFVDEIPFENLPNKFIIKCNHGSGTNILCTNKAELDIDKTKKLIHKWMKKNTYNFGREWPYKYVRKKIIVEYLLEEDGKLPKDYKLWVFNGSVKYINVHFKSNNITHMNIYDRNWGLQNFSMVYPNDLYKHHEKPYNLTQMIEYAEKIACGHKFLRIDFYEVNRKLYFGEITFYPTSGLMKFYPNHDELDYFYGSLLEL